MLGKTEIDKTEALIDSAHALKDALRQDRHRPTYHFLPPAGWMNDINGAIFWQGRYHIFFQHNPEGGWWKWMQWGHASSVDLVHWVHHPIALTPTPGGPDRDGCFSGGAFLNKEGVPTFIYYGVPDGECIATSGDDLLIHWTKHPDNPVIPQPGTNGLYYGECKHVHDPCAWLAGDTYYALTNRRDPEDRGDGAFLFRSQDLAHWQHVSLFYESDRRWTEGDEDCAVPDFFPLGDKHMLLFCSHLQATQYYLGRLENERFIPEHHARMSWPGGQLGGPRTLADASGRRIFFDWIRELRGEEQERASGWSGVMTLPRVLSLADEGTLRIDPVPELEVLRMQPHVRRDIHLAAGAEIALDDIRGDCLELAVQIEPAKAEAVGVKVRCSPDGAEQTVILYDAAAGKLKVGISRSSLDEEIRYPYYRNQKALSRMPEEARCVAAQEAPFALAAGETLTLRVFLDRSVLEVFANGRQCITQRIYPSRSDSTGIALFSRGGSANVELLEAWPMAPIHD